MIAAIYARKSTEQAVADEQKSVARQVDHARQYAARKGWTVDEACVFVDDGISGAEFARRPGFVRLMNALKPRPPFQVLIVSELSRLGREQLETGYAVKQLSQAGVSIHSYLEGRELALGSATDVFVMNAINYAATVEREKAAQRAVDKAKQLALAGHVTGGRVFGYDNVDVVDAGGRRSHVERRINEGEAAIVRRVFQLCAEGLGVKAIAKRLNAEGTQSPRAQLGRSQTWAPTSVREVLHRDLYRGVITWNRTRKRDRWGAKHQAPRPPADWIDVPAPHLAIVTAEQWNAAHARLAAARQMWNMGGRPPLGSPSKYLLTNLALCGRCGESLRVRSRKGATNGAERRFFYGCAGYHDRGICTNGADAPMADANLVLVEALLDDVLDPSILRDAVDVALDILQGGRRGATPIDGIEAQLAKVRGERQRLLAAITDGRTIAGLLEALEALEQREAALTSKLAAIAPQRPVGRADAARMRADLIELSQSWRRVLVDDPENARPIVTSLLKGRVTLTPAAPRQWTMSGEGTIDGLFERVFPSVVRPHRDSNPGFSLERAAS